MNYTTSSTSVLPQRRRLRHRVLAASAAAMTGAAVLSAAFVVPATVASASSMTVPKSPYGAVYALSSYSNSWASVGATFKVPTINCSSGASRGQAFGVEADENGQIAAWSKVDAVCTGTKATYTLDVLANQTNFVEPGVSAGDVVVASAYQTATYIASTVHDLTSGYTWVADGSPIPNVYATGVFIGATNLKYTWAPFTTTSFTQVQVNGDYLGYQKPLQYNYGPPGSLLARTSALHGGESFTLSYV
jgi:hypothetical protein